MTSALPRQPAAKAPAQIGGQPHLRRGRPADAFVLATLMDISSAGVLSRLWAEEALPGQAWREAATARIVDPNHELGFSNTVIAEVGDEIAGMVALNLLPENGRSLAEAALPHEKLVMSLLSRVPGHLLIREIAVFSPFRGQGVGDALMEVCNEIALQQAGGNLALTVLAENLAARRLYTRHGFSHVTAEVGGPHAPIVELWRKDI